MSWPLTWSSPDEANGTALSMYVLDGNALGMTATEAWRRRDFVEFNQPNCIIVSIGYPITDSVYSPQRNTDFQPDPSGQNSSTTPGAVDGADALLNFIEGSLRPFVHSQFPKVNFTRDALYGHSSGGYFVVYALLHRLGLFDTYLASSPGSAIWNKSVLTKWKDEAVKNDTKTKPAVRLAYGSLEAHSVKRRTETEEEFQTRAEFYAMFSVGNSTIDIYESLKDDQNLRDVELKEYPWSNHASLGAVGLTDGIDYFLDW